MKKTIIFMRHGKAADAFEYADDFERPLEHRGKTEVREAAQNLKDAGVVPDIIIASPACRTASTARVAASVFGIPESDIVYHAPLYMCGRKDYLNAANLSDKKVILIVGHNPFVGEWSMHFSNGKIHSFPTSSATAFTFKNDPVSADENPEMIYSNLRK